MSQPPEWSGEPAPAGTATVLTEPVAEAARFDEPHPGEGVLGLSAAPSWLGAAVPLQRTETPPVPGATVLAGAAPVDRAEFLRRVEAALTATERYALVQFGLDNFRHLNAAAGTEVGDSVLRRFGIAVATSFGDREIARLGGDTFGVLFSYGEAADVVSAVNRALVRIAASDLSADGSGLRVTASAGVTLLDRPDCGAGAALLEADLAMAAAKRDGRNRMVVADARHGTSISAAHDWAARIRRALETDGFVLHAQRVRSLRHQLDHWELLVRLPLADGELLPPSQFLPVAEQFGLGRAVDEWVTRRAIGIVAAETARGAVVRLEVNLGENSLASGEFAQSLKAELAVSGIDPASLIFEVNGATAGVNFDDVKVFSARLRALGCSFAIDNFGVSAGALDQLRVLPLDYVKIDGSFVRHIAHSPADQKVVRALTGLAHELGYEVIAMSVSDDRSVELLREFGVDYVQGFHVDRPYALEETR